MSDDDPGRDDIPQRTRGCRVCGWETWDGECERCWKRERQPNKYGALVITDEQAREYRRLREIEREYDRAEAEYYEQY